MAIQIQVRRDTAANWTAEDPTLAEGEFGMETDTFQLKIGDGSTAWVGLPYVVDSANPFDQDLNTTDPVEFTGLTSNGLTYPTADGTAGQVIETDGAGNLSFSSIGGVSSLTAGTGISVDVTTGDITITNSEPDQTVVLTDGTGITVTGTYPSFTIDCDITQYADADARLSLSAGTGISYDDATGIITNSEPDQTVTLTDGNGITITGTYPSFTIDCDITQYADADARLSLSAGTGISYDDTTGIITNSEPDQTVTLTDGADITITGTYPSFTIAYSGTAGSGTVTTASVVSANGFAGTVATDTTTPAITITTSITGLIKGNGTALSAATAGTDYVVPSGSITGSAASLSATLAVASGGTGVTTSTGSGNNVLSTSPTLVTPILGTPTSGTLTSCTGLPIATGVSGLGTSVATFLATPSSANLASCLTDETGSGLAVFATSPTLTTATITSLVETKTAPTISSGTLTLNCSLGNVFHVSLNAAITTLTISNIPTTGSAFGITLAFTMDGTARAVTWGASIKWSGGTAPTLTSTSSKVDIFVLTTWDGGTTWFAMVGGQNF